VVVVAFEATLDAANANSKNTGTEAYGPPWHGWGGWAERFRIVRVAPEQIFRGWGLLALPNRHDASWIDLDRAAIRIHDPSLATRPCHDHVAKLRLRGSRYLCVPLPPIDGDLWIDDL
jgi:hypothetical protein